MNTTIPSSDRAVSHPQAFDIMTPLASRSLFWQARYLKTDPVLHQLPFLFWLIETIRPRSVVQLGGNSGVAYFAACQALERLDCDVLCQMIGLWDRDEIPQELVDYNRSHFDDFSTLSKAGFKPSPRRFANGSVDLLMVDLTLTTEQVETLIKSWVPKLSSRGVVLIHGLDRQVSEVQDQLESLFEAHPSFILENGEGQVMILPGQDYPEKIEKLAGLSLGMPGYSDVQKVFKRLGTMHYLEGVWDANRSALDAARQDLEQARNQLNDSQASSRKMDDRLKELDAAYHERTRQIAILQSKMFDLETQQANVDTDARRAFEEALETQKKEIAYLGERLKEKDSALLAAQEAAKTAQGDTAEVTHTLEAKTAEFEKNMALVRKDNSNLRQQVEALQAELGMAHTAQGKAEEHSASLAKKFEIQLEELQQVAEKREELTQALKLIRQDNADLRTSVETQKAELEAAKAKKGDDAKLLKTQAAEYDKNLGLIRKDNAELRAQAARALEQLEAQAAEYEKNLGLIRKDNSELRQAYGNLQAELDAAQATKVEDDAALKAQTAENVHLLEEVERFRIDLEVVRSEAAAQYAEAMDKAESDRQKLSKKGEQKDRELALLTKMLRDEEDKRNKAEAMAQTQQNARFAETAELTRMLESREAVAKAAYSELETSLKAQLRKQAKDADQQRQKRQAFEAQVQSLSTDLNAAGTKVLGLETGMAARFTELAKMTRMLERQAETAEQMAQVEAGLREQVRTRDASIETLDAQLRDTGEHLRSKKVEADSLGVKLQAKTAEVADLGAQLQQKVIEAEQFRERSEALAAQIDDILRSTSWKITGPARKLLDSARRKS